MSSENLAGEQPELTPQKKKKPYEKPLFRCDQVFVTSALSCGKVGGGGECFLKPSAS
jgi:hypothetical protein